MSEASWPAVLAAMDEDLRRAERALREDGDAPEVSWSPPRGLGPLPEVHAATARELLRRTRQVQSLAAARLRGLGTELDEVRYRHGAASAYATGAVEHDSLSSRRAGR